MDGLLSNAVKREVVFGSSRLSQARWAVGSLFFLNGMLFATWVSRIPLIQQSLGLSHAVLGGALLAAAGGAVVTMPLAGWIVGRVGSERLTSWCVVPYCITLPLLALAGNIWALVAVLFLFGAGHGALDIGVNAQSVAVDRRYGRPILSGFHAMFSTGGLAGATVGALLVRLELAPLWHFIAVAGVMAAAGWIACGRLLPAVDRVEKVAGRAAATFALPPKSLIPLGLIAVAVLIGEGAMADWTGVYLSRELGTSEAIAAAGYAAFSIAMAIGRFSGDRLSHRFGDVAMVRTSGLVAAAGLVVALFSGSPLVSLAGFALVGAGYSTVVPHVFGAAGRTPGVETGLALASVTTMGYLGFLIGPPLIGLIADGIGLRLALAMLVATSLLAAALAPALRRPAAKRG